ncbi:MAG: TatD family hydrolase [Candidatus Fermentibacterota bacterium]
MSDAPSLRVFDTHCHLSCRGLCERAEEVVRRARGAGVARMLSLGTTVEDSGVCLDLARRFGPVYAAAGIHPNDTAGLDPEAELGKIYRMLLEPEVIAVGETGLDLHHRRVPLEAQARWLRAHAEMAHALNLPLVVHSRAAEAECLEVLPESPPFPVVMHCYTGPDRVALEAAGRGYWTGFAGPLTFKSNRRLRELAGRLPPERLVVETDAPFLAPEPHRGGRNEPALAVHTARVAAEAMGMPEAKATETLWNSSLRLLGLERYARTDPLYILGDSIYVNVTGRCDNDCTFCVRRRTPGLGGYYLRHRGEFEEERLEKAVELLDPAWFGEVVFCGYGEPTMRPELVRRLAGSVRSRGGRARLNTNGLSPGRMPREEVARIVSAFDSLSVSLNAADPETYRRICRPGDPRAWEHLMSFLELARESAAEVRLTAVAGSGADMAACAALAERLGFPFHQRGGS